MKAELVQNIGNQRFYKLTEPLLEIEKRVNSKIDVKYRFIVCISDAIGFKERLVFLGYWNSNSNEYDVSSYTDIAGRMHGKVFEDKVYLRYLAKQNNLKFEGILEGVKHHE